MKAAVVTIMKQDHMASRSETNLLNPDFIILIPTLIMKYQMRTEFSLRDEVTRFYILSLTNDCNGISYLGTFINNWMVRASFSNREHVEYSMFWGKRLA